MDRCISRPLPSPLPRHPPGLANHTQRETPLLDKVCGEVTVTDPAHPLSGQTLPRLPVRINRNPLQVMVLLPSGRRHMVPRAATNLERPEGAVSPAAPLPVISVRTILPLARLVQQLGAWPRRKAMPSRQRQPSIPQSTVSPVPATIFYRLPQSHQQPLAHLIANLIGRVRTAAQDREGNHERSRSCLSHRRPTSEPRWPMSPFVNPLSCR
jgi:hypothetical protein